MKDRIQIIPLLEDNYAYLLRDPNTGRTAIVDPSEASPIIDKAKQLGWSLDFILNTHHHWDHVGGNEELKKHFGCRIIGPRFDEKRIPGMDQGVEDQEEFSLGDTKIIAIAVPGHTLGAISYWIPSWNAVFTGDTLFLLGCGRLFEGTPQQMWTSLAKISRLPDNTLVYCGHEYTLANARFALSVDPANSTLRKRAAQAESLCSQGKFTVPALLEEERLANPFLRAGSVEEFARLRTAKDHFRG